MSASLHHSNPKQIILSLIVIALFFMAGKWIINQKPSQPTLASPFKDLPMFKVHPSPWPLTSKTTIDAANIQAKALILVNEDTGQILAERQSDTRYPIASTTKIMTAALALEFTQPGSLITIPDSVFDGLPEDSAYMGVTPGEKYTVEELLYGLMLSSGNDAANTLAIAISGSKSKFVDLMNAKALQLNLQNTHFTNPAGLDNPNHYSTAHDLAIIAHYARSFPLFKEIVNAPGKTLYYSTNHKQLELENLNSMVATYAGATGIKPGNTGEAGNCLVASANRGGIRLIGVLLDTPGRNSNMATLFDLGFANPR